MLEVAVFQPPYGKPWLLYVLLGSSLALNLVMVLDRPSSDAGEDGAEASDSDATSSGGSEAAPPPDGAPAPTAQASAATPGAVLKGTGWQVTSAQVEDNLSRTFQNTAGEKGDALSAAYARLFVWDLDLRRDLQKGDRVEVLWRPDDQSVVEIAAARFHSVKLGRTIDAWRWQRPGDAFESYWSSDGVEVPHRLVEGPIEEYQQITALLKDRPKHKGMDFKVPDGGEVVSPRAATVTRVNWNWAANGNCVELQYDDGVVAKLLHLSENKVEAGQRVAKGQLVALSGNTGHSTAPHLHYELARGEQVLDPLDYHQTEQRRLSPEELVAFQAQQARLAVTLDQALASL